MCMLPGSFQEAASPVPFLPQENTCPFSLKLQNTENIKLPGADMLLSREAPSTDLRRSLSTNYPLPSSLPTAGQQ